MDGPKTVAVDWGVEQVRLTVHTARGQVQGAGLYEKGSTAEWSVTSPIVEDGTRYVADPASGHCDDGRG